MWPIFKIKKELNKKGSSKPRRAIDGLPIPGMENDPTDDGNSNVIYDLDAIHEEIENEQPAKRFR